MTERLYYTDAGLIRFEATVLGAAPAGDGFEVVLDRTAFYPSSGGQPFDTGRLDGVRVQDVIDRESGEIAHVVDAPIAAGAVVTGEIDWHRRFDHMQQHTGQHVLSAAFEKLAGVRTASFHLGVDAATIDLHREVSAAEVDAAEAEACRVVWEDRPVTVRFVTEEEASRLPLRKEPARSGQLRLVEVTDFDLSACGGTHVSRTGQIGIVVVGATERYKGATRITFMCGRRALGSYRHLRDVVGASSRAVSVSASELPAAVERLLSDGKSWQRLAKSQADALAGYRARDYVQKAETIGPHRGVLREERDLDPAALKTLAMAIVGESGVVTVLVGGGAPASVVAARSADVNWDAGAWIKQVVARFGGRGGGRPELAQGGLPAPVEVILDAARQSLRSGGQ